MGSTTLSFHDFSWRGDRKWERASRWTVYAPIVQCFNLLFSIVQIAAGSTWIAMMEEDLKVPMVIQTILLPGCSFFNTIPSLHLHMLLRNNPPTMAVIMSSLFVICYLASVILMLAACVPSSPDGIPHGLRANQCQKGISGGFTSHGVSKPIWYLLLVFQWFSIVGYTVHGIMGWKVRSFIRGKKMRGEIDVVDPDEEEAKRAKARELWSKQYRMEGL